MVSFRCECKCYQRVCVEAGVWFLISVFRNFRNLQRWSSWLWRGFNTAEVLGSIPSLCIILLPFCFFSLATVGTTALHYIPTRLFITQPWASNLVGFRYWYMLCNPFYLIANYYSLHTGEWVPGTFQSHKSHNMSTVTYHSVIVITSLLVFIAVLKLCTFLLLWGPLSSSSSYVFMHSS